MMTALWCTVDLLLALSALATLSAMARSMASIATTLTEIRDELRGRRA